MTNQILSPAQTEILPLLKNFNDKFYLAGGTAVALQIKHRKSIDFDLFCGQKINTQKISLSLKKEIQEIIIQNEDELTVLINGVKVTFLYYPFEIKQETWFEDVIQMPSLLDLSAMKAYTVGRRSELKDYVDLYFLLKDHVSLSDLEKRATEIFGSLFSAKLFRSQLVYFDDIDFAQEIVFTDEKVGKDDLEEFFGKIISVNF